MCRDTLWSRTAAEALRRSEDYGQKVPKGVPKIRTTSTIALILQVLGSMPELRELWMCRDTRWSGASVEALCRVCSSRGGGLTLNTTETDVHDALVWVPMDDHIKPTAMSDLV